MNQSQRNYLVEQIEKTTKLKLKALEDSKPKPPSLKNHILNGIMSGTIEMQSIESIRKVIEGRVLESTTDDSWTKARSWSSSRETEITFDFEDIFVIPAEYVKLLEVYKADTEKINNEIAELASKSNTMILRIKLASAKTLQTMIQEVDDMGNLTLMDTKLKELPGI